MAARAILAATLTLALLASFDAPRAAPMDRFPRLVLWAWERPVDLRALPPDVGVAFLAQTITATARGHVVLPRRQPLRVAPATPLIAVTRIETPGGDARSDRVDDIARAIASTATLPRVAAVQVDFDATLSQRPMYRQLLHAVRRALPPAIPLSITALASWCMHDDWLGDLPIDEAVPMLFRMGPAEEPLRAMAAERLRAPACRGAIGTSLDEPIGFPRAGKRVYVFNPGPWTAGTIAEAMTAMKSTDSEPLVGGGARGIGRHGLRARLRPVPDGVSRECKPSARAHPAPVLARQRRRGPAAVRAPIPGAGLPALLGSASRCPGGPARVTAARRLEQAAADAPSSSGPRSARRFSTEEPVRCDLAYRVEVNRRVGGGYQSIQNCLDDAFLSAMRTARARMSTYGGAESPQVRDVGARAGRRVQELHGRPARPAGTGARDRGCADARGPRLSDGRRLLLRHAVRRSGAPLPRDCGEDATSPWRPYGPAILAARALIRSGTTPDKYVMEPLVSRASGAAGHSRRIRRRRACTRPRADCSTSSRRTFTPGSASRGDLERPARQAALSPQQRDRLPVADGSARRRLPQRTSTTALVLP